MSIDMNAVEMTVEAGVATLRLNRPDKLNAVNADVRGALLRHFDRIEDDGEIRAVLLTGAGRAFCSGADVSGPGVPRSPQPIRRRIAEHHAVVSRLYNLPKPVVAAVRGAVVGMGWSYALCCDLVIASETTQFWQPLVGRGGVPDGGAIWLLARQIGALRAQEFVYSGRKLGAKEAHALGLVNEVHADADLDAAALGKVRELSEMPTYSIGLTKALFHANSPNLEDFLAREVGQVPLGSLSEDALEAGAAGREKRKPKYRGL